MWIDSETDRHMNRWTNTSTDRHADKQTKIQTNRQLNKQTNTRTDIVIQKDERVNGCPTVRQVGGWTNWLIGQLMDKQTDIMTNKQTDRWTDNI